MAPVLGLSATVLADGLPFALVHSRPAQLRLSHEIVKLPRGEDMGLSGVGYLVNATPATYLGLSAYGATSGGRGGFFTGGVTAGTGARWGRTTLDAGLFVGGGGGGAAPQGGGLMIRPHLGIGYDLGGYQWGLGASWVKFPNGGIDSKQAFVSLGVPFEVLYADRSRAWAHLENAAGWDEQAAQLKATTGRYRADSGALTTGGRRQADFGTIGFAYERKLGEGGWFAVLETAGARDGSSDGYAEVLAGGGWGVTLPATRTQLKLALALGAAGGGSVDTQGGGIARAKLTVHQPFGNRAGIGLNLGKLTSAGRFGADYLGIDLTYRLGEVTRGNATPRSLYLQPWNIGFSQQHYAKAQRKSGPGQDLDLVGVKISRPLDDHFYLTAQAYGAYAGEAGGYAVGLMGLGAEWPLASRWRVSLEALAGAGGGGGVASGGGALWQAQAGLAYQLTRASHLQMEIGKVTAPSGNLNATLLNLNWVYRFARPEVGVGTGYVNR